jgi:predicted Zn-ribbon and HTH transcriptional regulator
MPKARHDLESDKQADALRIYVGNPANAMQVAEALASMCRTAKKSTDRSLYAPAVAYLSAYVELADSTEFAEPPVRIFKLICDNCEYRFQTSRIEDDCPACGSDNIMGDE